jgi:hypothetical protein
MQGSVLDLWQTNSTGNYDYKGFNLRGKIVTDKPGKYVLGPNHIHIMVGVPGQPIITIQA